MKLKAIDKNDKLEIENTDVRVTATVPHNQVLRACMR